MLKLGLSGLALLASAGLAAFADQPATTNIWLDTLNVTTMRTGWGGPVKNRSTDRNPLTLCGQRFARGIGTHAPSTYKVLLGGNALSFTATVGIDDETNGNGDSVFRVIADGRVVAESPLLKGRQKAELKADLTGAKSAILEVTAGEGGKNYDHADWANAFFTFKAGTGPADPRTMTRQLGILTPPESPAPRINGPSVFGVRPGRPILYKVPVTGTRPLSISVAGLPEGATFDSARGLFGGRVARAGDYPLVITAKNAAGTATRAFTLKVGDKIALTPPLGWNSWNAFGPNISDKLIRTMADLLVSSGLAEHGWAYLNIDDYWQNSPTKGAQSRHLAGAERLPCGRINTNARFPDMKALADYIHSKGLKAGLYSSPGPLTCGQCTGSWMHEAQDARTYAEWGYDFLKYDWCSYGKVALGEDKSLGRAMLPYYLMGRALKAQGRDIVFSLCQYGMNEVQTWGTRVDGQLWRTTGDVSDSWVSIVGSIHKQARVWPWSGPSSWNDADMLCIGATCWTPRGVQSRLSPNEQYAHMTFWAITAAPLMIGCDLRRLDPLTRSLLANDEVLDVNQDVLGAAAARLHFKDEAGIEVWGRPLADGSVAVAFLNLDAEEQGMVLPMSDYGMEGRWRVRDLWRQQDEGVFAGSYSHVVYGHGTHFIRLFPTDGAKMARGREDIRDNAWRTAMEKDRPVEPRHAAPAGAPCADCPGGRNAAAMTAGGAADEYDEPVRPIGVNGQAPWNVRAQYFKYAPTFGFPADGKAKRYRFTVTDDTGAKHVFETDRPNVPLTPVWSRVPEGWTTVRAEGLDAQGAVTGLAGERRFWKEPGFVEGAYPKQAMTHAEAARKMLDYVCHAPIVDYLLKNGRPDPGYAHNGYPSKMLAAQIEALLEYADLEPKEAERSLRAAKLNGDWLIANAEKPGTPLEHFTQTYEGEGENGTSRANAGQHMLCYPARAGEVLLALGKRTGEAKYREHALKIGETYLRLQGEDGTWYLKMFARDGRPSGQNRLVPFDVIDFFEALAKETGDAKWQAAADRAFAYIEKKLLVSWNWEGQFEDTPASRPYQNLTHFGACWTARRLLNRYPGDAARLAQARELLRFAEDQFVSWVSPHSKGRYPQGWKKNWWNDYDAWTCPGVREQYNCYMPIDGSAAGLIKTYLAFHGATGDRRDLAKAKALGDTVTRMVGANGRIPTFWVNGRGGGGGWWVNCQIGTARAMSQLAKQ